VYNSKYPVCGCNNNNNNNNNNNSVVQGSSWEANGFSTRQRNSQHFMETEISLLCLQQRVPVLSQMNPTHTRI
jgi:hypothetical protein